MFCNSYNRSKAELSVWANPELRIRLTTTVLYSHQNQQYGCFRPAPCDAAEAARPPFGPRRGSQPRLVIVCDLEIADGMASAGYAVTASPS